jgi:hypothetical protein
MNPTPLQPAREDVIGNVPGSPRLPKIERNIQYDRHTGDLAMSIRIDDGPWQLVGYCAGSNTDADRTLDELVHSILTHDARLRPVASPAI